ncbi:glycosyltransferase [Streptomyces kaniharaensis]|uniref:Glycosyltransferase n=1 Tax=Streptomyces kaniharaensis TaxID=212423 RepID=A0A6N7KXC3_9ACTN|nr:glycosyltransferase [Streptomyces kaniharaensis]MQS15209.1 glycosyltransferase [Streptomyces kaniharaensis]
MTTTVTESLEREAARPADRTSTEGRPTAGRSVWVVRGALPVALALWLLALPRVQLSRMDDLGLLQALPPLYFAALAVLTCGFVVAVRDPRTRQGWLAAYVLGLITLIHATPSILYPTLRYAWAWKHIAIVDAMLRHHGTVQGAGKLDVYNQWPGFFELNGLFLRVTGLPSALGYASWYPVIANVLLMGPLLLLYRSLTKDRRLIWAGIWLYYSAAWVGQDYFSPQAFAYLLFVTVIALVMRQLAALRELAEDGPGASGARAVSSAGEMSRRGGWRPVPFVLLLVLIAAIVSSHQLTPIMLIACLAMLSLPRRNRRTVLPLLAAAVALTFLWDATVARPFMSEHVGSLVTALTSPDHNAVAGFAELSNAAPGQVLASWVDRAMTASVFLLAVAGAVRHRWVRRTSLPLLLVAPLVLLPANAYEGEMLFRAYLLALPAAAFLAATLLLGTRPVGLLRTGVMSAVLLALVGGFLFGYFSKEKMNYFPPGEVAAVRYVTNTPPGSMIVSLTSNEPGGELNYDSHDRFVLAGTSVPDRERLVADPEHVLQGVLQRRDVAGPTYLILSRAQAADCELTGLLPQSTVEQVEAAAARASDLRVVLKNSDAVVYQYVAQAPDQVVGGGSAR